MFALFCCAIALTHAAAALPPIPAAKLHAVDIRSEGGEVRVKATRSNNITATFEKTLGKETCKLTQEVRKGVATLTVKDSDNAPCRIDVVVAMPAELKLHIEAAEGHVFVSGLHSALEVVLGSGNAVLGGEFPRLSAQLADGSLSVQGLNGDAELEVHSGNVQLWYGQKPRGTAVLNVERGNVTVSAPTRAVSVTTTVEQGRCTNTLENVAEAPLKFSGRIGRGNLSIRGKG